MGNLLGRGKSLNILGKKINNFIVIDRLVNWTSKTGKEYVTWICKCVCGKEFTTTSKQITKDKKSCGCLSHSNRFKKVDKLQSAITGRLCHYKNAAKRRNLIWELTKEQFKEFILGNCKYCEIEPCLLYTRRGSDILFNGIDRIDSSEGYYKENCVSCCHICNRAKSDLKVEEFLKWIKRLQKLAQ